MLLQTRKCLFPFYFCVCVFFRNLMDFFVFQFPVSGKKSVQIVTHIEKESKQDMAIMSFDL